MLTADACLPCWHCLRSHTRKHSSKLYRCEIRAVLRLVSRAAMLSGHHKQASTYLHCCAMFRPVATPSLTDRICMRYPCTGPALSAVSCGQLARFCYALTEQASGCQDPQ